MNYLPVLPTVMCHGCGAECWPEELHAEHYELCIACGEGLEEELKAEQAEADDALRFHACNPRDHR